MCDLDGAVYEYGVYGVDVDVSIRAGGGDSGDFWGVRGDDDYRREPDDELDRGDEYVCQWDGEYSLGEYKVERVERDGECDWGAVWV